MSMMVSFVLSFFPRDVLDEILKLIESVSEDFPSYSLLGKDQRDFLCAKISKNSIVNENALNFERSLMHYKVRPSNYLFQLFLTL